MPTRTVNNIPWHYEDRGTAAPGRPPVVLLHAFPMDHRLYAAQLDDLSADHRVIVPDLPGFGRTPYDQPFTVKWQAEQVRAFLADLGALPCVIGGCSMGGYVALAFEREFPRDADALILIDTKAEGDTPDQRHNRDRLVELIDRHGPAAVADGMLPKMLSDHSKSAQPDLESRIKAVMLATPAATLKHALAALRDREDRTAFLPSIADPTLILVGEDDQITPVASAQVLKSGIRRATLHTIPQAGHLTPVENPSAVTAAIRTFIATLPTRNA